MPQLYSPVMKTKPSASRIWPASFSSRAGASPFGYSLYIRSSIGRPTARASISSTSSPRPRKPSTTNCASRMPRRLDRYEPYNTRMRLLMASAYYHAGLQGLVPLEILHLALVFLGCRARLEGAEIAAPAGFRVHFAGIEPVLA